MEFEDLQVIWKEQNNEKMFAINETALHATIKRKGKSINRSLEFIEWIMISINLGVGILLFVDTIRDNGADYQYLLSAMYLGYFFYAIFRRLKRRKAQIHFKSTVLGELDKALWQVNYVIKQGRSMVLWYVLPLGIVAAASMFLNGKTVWGLFLLLLFPASYLGARWEMNKWWHPKKRSLESIRDTLTSPESTYSSTKPTNHKE